MSTDKMNDSDFESRASEDVEIEEIAVTESSGNVFADLGVEEPEEALLKAKLAHAISTIIVKRRLTQKRAAEILGIDQPKVSALVRGRVTGYSIERLLRFLLALDLDIEIRVKPRARARGRAHLDVVAVA